MPAAVMVDGAPTELVWSAEGFGLSPFDHRVTPKGFFVSTAVASWLAEARGSYATRSTSLPAAAVKAADGGLGAVSSPITTPVLALGPVRDASPLYVSGARGWSATSGMVRPSHGS